MEFDPFNRKPFDEIVAPDLSILRNVSEGWFVEYKSEIGSAEVIAKAISAFANTHGGWLFYGIAEKSKAEPVAGTFPGISIADVEVAVNRIRSAAKDRVSPPPHYEIRSASGPCKDLDLPAGRAVLIVRVPKSYQTPHVHSSGVIYRRVGDGSEPVGERSHHEVVKLVERSSELESDYRRRLADTVQIDPSRTGPHLRLIIIPDIWRSKDTFLDTRDEEVRQLMGEASAELISTPFDTVHYSAFGFTGRQLQGNNLDSLGLTYQLRWSGISDVHIPFNFCKFATTKEIAAYLKGYDSAKQFAALLGRHKFDSLCVVDLNFLFSAIVGVLNIQQRICRHLKWEGSRHVKFELENVGWSIPFLDVKQVVDHFEECGVPTVLRNRIEYPIGYKPDNLMELEPGTSVLMDAALVFQVITRCFGIQDFDQWKSVEDDFDFITALTGAAQRAGEVQQARSKAV